MTDQEPKTGTTPPRAETGIATEALIVPVAPVPGSSRGRWLVALGVAGVAIAATIAAVLLLGGPGMPEALRYVPRDALFVAELRLDLPGDQRQRVGNLLAHFPGFADQSTLDLKIDEAMQRLVNMATDAEVDYRTDLKPWLAGPVFAAARAADVTASQPNGLVVATTDGSVGCEAALEGQPLTTETHRDVELKVIQAGDVACVVDGRVVIFGDRTSVIAAIDAHADGRAIDTVAEYGSARAALAGDRLATVYLSGAGLADLGDEPGALPPSLLGVAAAVPDWAVLGLRAEDDALVVDVVTAPLPAPSGGPSLRPLPSSHASALVSHVPGDAMVYAELQGASVTLLNALAVFRADPTLGPQLAEIDQVLTAFGGAERLLGWADDAALVILSGEGTPIEELRAGVLLLAPDAATATDRVAAYRSLLALAALGGGVEVTTQTSGTLEVTTVTIPEAGGLGLDGPVQLSFAASDRLVAVATGEAFVADILGGGGRILADVPEYEATAARGLSPAMASLYLSIDGLVATARANMPPDQVASFETDVEPYLAPLDGLQLTAVEQAGASRLRIVMSVSNPPTTP